LVDPLDARVDDLSAPRAIRRADDFPLPGLVDEAIADSKLHRQDGAGGRRRWLGGFFASRFFFFLERARPTTWSRLVTVSRQLHALVNAEQEERLK